MITYRTLARPLATARGTYVAGLQVVEIRSRRLGYVRLCLDPHGAHLADRCHAVHVRPEALEPGKIDVQRHETVRRAA